LKPHHLPFKILKKWHDILESLATGDTYSEEPTLYWKRDALVHVGLEKKHHASSAAIEMFYQELVFNVAYSFYPTSLPEAVELASVALRVEKGTAATKADMQTVTGCTLPPHLESKSWGWTWRRKVWHAYSHIQNQPGSKHDWQKQYLQIGWRWGYYGSTFFYGGLEHEHPGNPDQIVRVGVNFDGIHVIDDATNTIRLSLGFDEFSFNSYESVDEDDSFLIEFDGNDGTKHHMIVWSPQANMMDNLVTRYIELLSDWNEHVKERKASRKSFKPGPTKGGKAPTKDATHYKATEKRHASEGTMSIGGTLDTTRALKNSSAV
jgi:hypothetical protein